MTKERKKLTGNLWHASKTALIREIKALREELKYSQYAAKDYKELYEKGEREIERRNNASAMFRELEPLALQKALMAYDLWEAEGYPTIYGTNSSTYDRIEPKGYVSDYWHAIYCDRIEDYLKAIRKAKQAKLKGWKTKY